MFKEPVAKMMGPDQAGVNRGPQNTPKNAMDPWDAPHLTNIRDAISALAAVGKVLFGLEGHQRPPTVSALDDSWASLVRARQTLSDRLNNYEAQGYDCSHSSFILGCQWETACNGDYLALYEKRRLELCGASAISQPPTDPGNGDAPLIRAIETARRDLVQQGAAFRAVARNAPPEAYAQVAEARVRQTDAGGY